MFAILLALAAASSGGEALADRFARLCLDGGPRSKSCACEARAFAAVADPGLLDWMLTRRRPAGWSDADLLRLMDAANAGAADAIEACRLAAGYAPVPDEFMGGSGPNP